MRAWEFLAGDSAFDDWGAPIAALKGMAIVATIEARVRRQLMLMDLQPSADLTDLKLAYRRLARRYHPDRNPVSDSKSQGDQKRYRHCRDRLREILEI